MSQIEFSDCPCCGAKKYALLQDKVHLDWARTCLACGYEHELMPRAISRVNAYSFTQLDEDEGEVVRAGFHVGNIDDLFLELASE